MFLAILLAGEGHSARVRYSESGEKVGLWKDLQFRSTTHLKNSLPVSRRWDSALQ